MNLNDKTALVSGANRGIGRALVDALLQRGVAKVYAAARDPGSLPAYDDQRVVGMRLDIRDADQIVQAAEFAKDVDLLINNAGTAAFASLVKSPRDQIKHDMDTNYYGTLDMIRAFVPILETKEDAGIVNLVTIAAFVNFPSLGGYSASKAALFSLSQGVRMELAPKGIAVHTVNPGPIDTDMAKDLDMEKATPESAVENILNGLENGEADIFPDDGGRQMFDVWSNNYRDLEQMVADMHSAE